jgi:hypothetical protein
MQMFHFFFPKIYSKLITWANVSFHVIYKYSCKGCLRLKKWKCASSVSIKLMIIFKRVFDDDSKIFSNNMERWLDGDFITKMGGGKENHKISNPCAMLQIAILKINSKAIKRLFIWINNYLYNLINNVALFW